MTQKEIAEQIASRGNCDGISCYGDSCPLRGGHCNRGNKSAHIAAAREWLKQHAAEPAEPEQLDPVVIAAELEKTWQGKCAAWLTTYGIQLPSEYRFTSFRRCGVGDTAITWKSINDGLFKCERPILERVKPAMLWVVPTDEDAKRRPKCRVRSKSTEQWQYGRILVRVNNYQTSRFCTENEPGICIQFPFCEIEKEIN